MRLYSEEQEDGDERPDLDFGLTVGGGIKGRLGMYRSHGCGNLPCPPIHTRRSAGDKKELSHNIVDIVCKEDLGGRGP